MREDRDNSRYYHGGLQSGHDVYDFDRDTRDGDFGRQYQDRYRNGNNPHSFRDRRDFDANRFRTYPRRDHDVEDVYGESTRRSRHELSTIRQGYGIPSMDRRDEESERVHQMQRERRAQQEQGYGSGRLSGYSGSRFGGANYSAHGDFGGSSHYGAMSGTGGNMEHTVSSSGYGGGHTYHPMHADSGSRSDQREPVYMGHNPRERQYFGGNRWNIHGNEYHRGNRSDRGGYSDFDPNY